MMMLPYNNIIKITSLLSKLLLFVNIIIIKITNTHYRNMHIMQDYHGRLSPWTGENNKEGLITTNRENSK